MFLTNKYRIWYFQIIERAKFRDLPRRGTEGHHIIPRCAGGSNNPDNIARLTYREHFLVHWLLPKFTEGRLRYKMLSALWQMSRAPRQYARIAASWQYEIARIAVAEVTAARNIGNKYSVGRKWTNGQYESHRLMMLARKQTPTLESTRDKIRLARLGTTASEETKKKMSAIRTGKKHTEESKNKIGNGNKGKVRSLECRENLRNQKLGKKLSLETRQRMSASHLARKFQHQA
jgi:hypothetical protein